MSNEKRLAELSDQELRERVEKHSQRCWRNDARYFDLGNGTGELRVAYLSVVDPKTGISSWHRVHGDRYELSASTSVIAACKLELDSRHNGRLEAQARAKQERRAAEEDVVARIEAEIIALQERERIEDERQPSLKRRANGRRLAT